MVAHATLASPASSRCPKTEGDGATAQGLVKAAGLVLGTATVTLTNAQDGVWGSVPTLSLYSSPAERPSTVCLSTTAVAGVT